MKLVIACALLLATSPALGQTVFKCTGAAGTVYQSAPCAGGRQAERTYGGDYAVTPQRQAQIRREQSHAQAVSRRSTVAAGSYGAGYSPPPRESRNARCDAVKSQRDAAYRRMGNSRRAADIRYWAGVVHDACK